MAAINIGSTTAGRGAAEPRLETRVCHGALEADAAIADAFLQSAVGGDTAPARRRARFHTLEVAEVRPLTDDAVEVTFAVPDELADDYTYLPGQYVALRREFDGHELRRSYSICRPPVRGSVSVAIKRDLGGRFSTWANTEPRRGRPHRRDEPAGHLHLGARVARRQARGRHRRGSGITPLMALAHTVLVPRSDDARFTLVYTNRSTRDVMFLEELADLKDRYPPGSRCTTCSRASSAPPRCSRVASTPRSSSACSTCSSRRRPSTSGSCAGPFELVQLARDTLEARRARRASALRAFTTDADRATEPATVVRSSSSAARRRSRSSSRSTDCRRPSRAR